MKKVLNTLLVCLLLCLSLPGFAMAAGNNNIADDGSINTNLVNLKIDGINIQNDVSPIIIKNRTLVPIRVISECLGSTVDWMPKNKTITITANNIGVIELVLNKTTATFIPVGTNEKQNISLAVPATLKNNRTMVPLRFIAEAFGATVNYEKNIVTINTPAVYIDNYKIKALTDEYYMTMGSKMTAYYGNSNISQAYNLLKSGLGNKVTKPKYFGNNINLDTEYFYYLRSNLGFWTATPSENSQPYVKYAVYSYTSDNPNGQAPTEYGEMLVENVNTGIWYKFDETCYNAICDDILEKLNNTAMSSVIFNNIV